MHSPHHFSPATAGPASVTDAALARSTPFTLQRWVRLALACAGAGGARRLPLGMVAGLLVIFGSGCASTEVRATSVIPPDFKELVGKAAAIVRSRVVAVEPHWAVTDEGDEVIRTRVRFEILESLKGGGSSSKLELVFLGGKVGEDELEVVGMPRFTAGDEVFLFTDGATRLMCSLIRWGHGLYRVEREADGRAYVARADRTPLADPSEVRSPLGTALPAPIVRAKAAAAMSPAAFAAAVETQLKAIEEVSAHAR